MGSDLHGLWILGVSVAALLVGPAIHHVARRQPVTMAALDNFVLVIVVGLVTLEIFPAALALAGPLALVALLLGALGPALADGPLHRASHGTHSAALTLAIVGVALHSVTDGVALASAHAAGGHTHALEAAVIAHQLPVSVAVWWLLSPVGPVRATAAMFGLGLATVAGFVLADRFLTALDNAWLGALQALFAGFLLHVLAHRSGPVDPAPRTHLAASLGGLVGVVLLVLLALDDHGHADEPMPQMLAALVDLARSSAPVLLTALTLALVAALTLARIAPAARATTARATTAHGTAHGTTRDTTTARGTAHGTAHGAPAVLAALDRAAPWLTASLLISAALAPLPGTTILPTPTLQLLLLAALSVPAHALAPALLPLVALALPLGLDPGAALAFILVGPAAAAPRSPRVRVALVAATLGLALLLDLVPRHEFTGNNFPAADLAALALAALLLTSLVRQTPQQFLRRLWSPPSRHHSHKHPHEHPHSHGHTSQ